MTWRFTDASNMVVVRTNTDGSQDSRLASTLDWNIEETPDPYILPDWRPQAIADLNDLRAKLISILSAMQVDYFMAGNTASADACRDAKNGLRAIETSPTVQAIYLSPTGTRVAFDLAVKQQWGALVAPAPAQVRTDFVKYGGNTT